MLGKCEANCLHAIDTKLILLVDNPSQVVVIYRMVVEYLVFGDSRPGDGTL